MIELNQLTKCFGRQGSRDGEVRVVVDNINLHLNEGELLMLVGESGSGKTTTLRMINRLIEPTRGEIRLFRQDVRRMPPHKLRRRIGYAFQQVGLFPHLTVSENIATTPTLLGWPTRKIRAQIDNMLELVELAPEQYRDRWPHELSGGQQQRVGVARALAGNPELLLLDEPFGALDPSTRTTVQERFRSIRQQLGIGGVFVTHDLSEALLLGDRIGVMRKGRLIQVSRPADIIKHPADEGVRALFDAPIRQAQQMVRLAESPDFEGMGKMSHAD